MLESLRYGFLSANSSYIVACDPLICTFYIVHNRSYFYMENWEPYTRHLSRHRIEHLLLYLKYVERNLGWELTGNWGKTPKMRENSGNFTVTQKGKVVVSLVYVRLVPCVEVVSID